MRKLIVLFVLIFTSAGLRSQPTPYGNIGLSLEFGFDRCLYLTPKICLGYFFDEISFANLTVSYSYSTSNKLNSFWNFYSELGFPALLLPPNDSNSQPFSYGIGAGISTTTFDSIRVTSFRSNYFFGFAFGYMNYVHHTKMEFPDNIGVEGIFPFYAPYLKE
ncbi:MAG: hypothetical protein J0L62_08370 [Bacteroidetes bacterium]|nr:hypothetical protein [Bacteroidota bacterium]